MSVLFLPRVVLEVIHDSREDDNLYLYFEKALFQYEETLQRTRDE